MQNQSQTSTSSNADHGEQTTHHPSWTPMPLEHLPLPTYWPAGLAFAITLIFWGLITSWVVLTAGIVVFIISLAGWLQDIRNERRHTSSTH